MQQTDDHCRITDTVSIRERSANVSDPSLPVHWEAHLFFASRTCQVATLVERQTRYLTLVNVAVLDTQTVINP